MDTAPQGMSLSHMTNQLDPVFHALADPTRRAVVERLVDGPAAVGELARPFHMALPSFLQHLKVLERSGLVRSEKAGRVRTVHLEAAALMAAQAWLAEQRRQWERRLDRLETFLEEIDDEGHE